MSRPDFVMDALFGMTGVPREPGSCIIANEGASNEQFVHPNTEATYQVWLRGYHSKALAVRDRLTSELKNADSFYLDDDSMREGYKLALSGLLSEWWGEDFIPKRPGD